MVLLEDCKAINAHRAGAFYPHGIAWCSRKREIESPCFVPNRAFHEQDRPAFWRQRNGRFKVDSNPRGQAMQKKLSQQRTIK
jgi:hypothetical protein